MSDYAYIDATVDVWLLKDETVPDVAAAIQRIWQLMEGCPAIRGSEFSVEPEIKVSDEPRHSYRASITWSGAMRDRLRPDVVPQWNAVIEYLRKTFTCCEPRIVHRCLTSNGRVWEKSLARHIKGMRMQC